MKIVKMIVGIITVIQCVGCSVQPLAAIPSVQAVAMDTSDVKVIETHTHEDEHASSPVITEVSVEKSAKQKFVEELISKFPAHLSTSLTLIQVNDSFGVRGLSNGSRMYINLGKMSDQELSAVVIHELGHVIDLGYLLGKETPSPFMDGTSQVYANDPSVGFYSISWEASNKRKSRTPLDYVSGYAMSDPFEDFAESFAYYVLQGQNFRKMAKENEALKQKYSFIKEFIFQNKEFDLGEAAYISDGRSYDVTVLPYKFENLIAAL
ncbi:MAG: putative zinc-binding metallopeptidase [Candidatus Gracilibacteria bacterium]